VPFQGPLYSTPGWFLTRVESSLKFTFTRAQVTEYKKRVNPTWVSPVSPVVDVRTIVVLLNHVIHMNRPSVYMRKYGKVQLF